MLMSPTINRTPGPRNSPHVSLKRNREEREAPGLEAQSLSPLQPLASAPSRCMLQNSACSSVADWRAEIALIIIYLWNATGYLEHTVCGRQTQMGCGEGCPHHHSYTQGFANCCNIVTGFFPAWCLRALKLP